MKFCLLEIIQIILVILSYFIIVEVKQTNAAIQQSSDESINFKYLNLTKPKWINKNDETNVGATVSNEDDSSGDLIDDDLVDDSDDDSKTSTSDDYVYEDVTNQNHQTNYDDELSLNLADTTLATPLISSAVATTTAASTNDYTYDDEDEYEMEQYDDQNDDTNNEDSTDSDPYICPTQCKCKFNKLDSTLNSNNSSKESTKTKTIVSESDEYDETHRRNKRQQQQQDKASASVVDSSSSDYDYTDYENTVKYDIYVDCSSAELTSIVNLFDEEFPLEQIVSFNLSNNKLRMLKLEDGFEDMTGLQVLDLSSNPSIKSPSVRNFLKKFRHLKQIYLNNLPQLNCNQDKSNRQSSLIDCKWFKSLAYLNKKNVTIRIEKPFECNLEFLMRSTSTATRCLMNLNSVILNRKQTNIGDGSGGGGSGGDITINNSQNTNTQPLEFKLENTNFELKLEPDLDQILIEGDTLELTCRFRKINPQGKQQTPFISNQLFLKNTTLNWMIVSNTNNNNNNVVNQLIASDINEEAQTSLDDIDSNSAACKPLITIYVSNRKLRTEIQLESKLVIKNACSSANTGKYFCSTQNLIYEKLNNLNTTTVEIKVLDKNELEPPPVGDVKDSDVTNQIKTNGVGGGSGSGGGIELYCPESISQTYKGVYKWPKTLANSRVKQRCLFTVNNIGTVISHAANSNENDDDDVDEDDDDSDDEFYASYECQSNGEWSDELDLSQCEYESNLTRYLERLTLLKPNGNLKLNTNINLDELIHQIVISSSSSASVPASTKTNSSRGGQSRISSTSSSSMSSISHPINMYDIIYIQRYLIASVNSSKLESYTWRRQFMWLNDMLAKLDKYNLNKAKQLDPFTFSTYFHKCLLPTILQDFLIDLPEFIELDQDYDYYYYYDTSVASSSSSVSASAPPAVATNTAAGTTNNIDPSTWNLLLNGNNSSTNMAGMPLLSSYLATIILSPSTSIIINSRSDSLNETTSNWNSTNSSNLKCQLEKYKLTQQIYFNCNLEDEKRQLGGVVDSLSSSSLNHDNLTTAVIAPAAEFNFNYLKNAKKQQIMFILFDSLNLVPFDESSLWSSSTSSSSTSSSSKSIDAATNFSSLNKMFILNRKEFNLKSLNEEDEQENQFGLCSQLIGLVTTSRHLIINPKLNNNKNQQQQQTNITGSSSPIDPASILTQIQSTPESNNSTINSTNNKNSFNLTIEIKMPLKIYRLLTLIESRLLNKTKQLKYENLSAAASAGMASVASSFALSLNEIKNLVEFDLNPFDQIFHSDDDDDDANTDTNNNDSTGTANQNQNDSVSRRHGFNKSNTPNQIRIEDIELKLLDSDYSHITNPNKLNELRKRLISWYSIETYQLVYGWLTTTNQQQTQQQQQQQSIKWSTKSDEFLNGNSNSSELINCNLDELEQNFYLNQFDDAVANDNNKNKTFLLNYKPLNSFRLFAKLKCHLDDVTPLTTLNNISNVTGNSNQSSNANKYNKKLNIQFVGLRHTAPGDSTPSGSNPNDELKEPFKSIIKMIDSYADLFKLDLNKDNMSILNRMSRLLKKNYRLFESRVLYFSSLISCLILTTTIVSYIILSKRLLMPRSLFHAYVNIWMCVLLLILVYLFGIGQIAMPHICLSTAVLLHYLTICTSVWYTLYFYCLFAKLNTLEKRNFNLIFNPNGENSKRIGGNKHEQTNKTGVYMSLSKKKANHQHQQQQQQRRDNHNDTSNESDFIKKPVIHLYMLGWGLPLLLSSIIISITKREFIQVPYCFCFTNEIHLLIGSVLAPQLAMLILKLIFLILIAITIRKILKDLKEDSDSDENETNKILKSDELNEKMELCQTWTNSRFNEAMGGGCCDDVVLKTPGEQSVQLKPSTNTNTNANANNPHKSLIVSVNDNNNAKFSYTIRTYDQKSCLSKSASSSSIRDNDDHNNNNNNNNNNNDEDDDDCASTCLSNNLSDQTSVMDTQHKPSIQLKFACLSLIIYLITWTMGACLASSYLIANRYYHHLLTNTTSNSTTNTTTTTATMASMNLNLIGISLVNEKEFYNLLRRVFSYLLALFMLIYSILQISFYLLSRDDCALFETNGTGSGFGKSKMIYLYKMVKCFRKPIETSSSTVDGKMTKTTRTTTKVDTKDKQDNVLNTENEKNWYFDSKRDLVDGGRVDTVCARLIHNSESSNQDNSINHHHHQQHQQQIYSTIPPNDDDFKLNETDKSVAGAVTVASINANLYQSTRLSHVSIRENYYHMDDKHDIEERHQVLGESTDDIDEDEHNKKSICDVMFSTKKSNSVINKHGAGAASPPPSTTVSIKSSSSYSNISDRVSTNNNTNNNETITNLKVNRAILSNSRYETMVNQQHQPSKMNNSSQQQQQVMMPRDLFIQTDLDKSQKPCLSNETTFKSPNPNVNESTLINNSNSASGNNSAKRSHHVRNPSVLSGSNAQTIQILTGGSGAGGVGGGGAIKDIGNNLSTNTPTRSGDNLNASGNTMIHNTQTKTTDTNKKTLTTSCSNSKRPVYVYVDYSYEEKLLKKIKTTSMSPTSSMASSSNTLAKTHHHSTNYSKLNVQSSEQHQSLNQTETKLNQQQQLQQQQVQHQQITPIANHLDVKQQTTTTNHINKFDDLFKNTCSRNTGAALDSIATLVSSDQHNHNHQHHHQSVEIAIKSSSSSSTNQNLSSADSSSSTCYIQTNLFNKLNPSTTTTTNGFDSTSSVSSSNTSSINTNNHLSNDLNAYKEFQNENYINESEHYQHPQYDYEDRVRCQIYLNQSTNKLLLLNQSNCNTTAGYQPLVITTNISSTKISHRTMPVLNYKANENVLRTNLIKHNNEFVDNIKHETSV